VVIVVDLAGFRALELWGQYFRVSFSCSPHWREDNTGPLSHSQLVTGALSSCFNH
jgi:hypothetical protein